MNVKDIKQIEIAFKSAKTVREIVELPVDKRQKQEKIKDLIKGKSALLVDKVLDYFDTKTFEDMKDQDVLKLLDTLTRNSLQESKSETTVNIFGDDMAKIVMQAQAEAIEKAKRESAIDVKVEKVQ